MTPMSLFLNLALSQTVQMYLRQLVNKWSHLWPDYFPSVLHNRSPPPPALHS
jgi:hypothetical protein